MNAQIESVQSGAVTSSTYSETVELKLLHKNLHFKFSEGKHNPRNKSSAITEQKAAHNVWLKRVCLKTEPTRRRMVHNSENGN